ncbi:MAG: Na/Pi cotransporter family protein [Desulfobacterales bacterium]|nr:Na/Pi cotransporter family protein [Desulfobacterales bacterium]MDX2513001.1 Na/Pi cotransporter family protein [Desulfobacterales bacterium]
MPSIFNIFVVGNTTSQEISWGFMIIGLCGGLALFLYGMEQMSEGLKKSAGNKMRSILSALTNNRIVGAVVGAFVTTVIQSSSATTVMLVSFVQAGLMSFAQSLGVILGADIGTTITAQLIAFKLTDYALLLIAVGFVMRTFGKGDNIRNIGEVLLGFGVLFYGMKLMSEAMKPLRTYAEFINLMKGLENPLLGLLVGTVFTALIQSSSAFTGIVIVMAQQGLITLDAGIPLVFGANIGTCITAGFASIGTSREAKRVALAHVLFKVCGVTLFIFWIPTFVDIIQAIATRFGSDTARQIANAHTIFNVSLALIFLPFTTVFARLLLKILPQEEELKGIVHVTWHLDESMISTPDFSIGLARTEITRMAKILGRMLKAIIIPFMSNAKFISREIKRKDEVDLLIKEIPTQDEIFPELTLLDGIDMREEKIDFLDEKIVDYLIKVARQEISNEQASEVFGMISIANDMESIGDIIHRNMMPLIVKMQDLTSDFSEEGKEELMIYHVKVCKQISRLTESFDEHSLETARKIMEKEEKYLDLETKYRLRHLERLQQERKKTVETHEVHMELLDLLKQINVYTANIAKTFLNTSNSDRSNL